MDQKVRAQIYIQQTPLGGLSGGEVNHALPLGAHVAVNGKFGRRIGIDVVQITAALYDPQSNILAHSPHFHLGELRSFAAVIAHPALLLKWQLVVALGRY